ncbi:MAG: tRNA (adenosine(37)-N6)-dimethylallyltransferase MiaA [Beijerinckiaceae bacterium]|nr:tRNA (adenosine(37)-N6)-dimethylallyltransferase MiaA [Beijerinckiaceae bacterium]MCZ8301211.1 tRNA (adenosine(37)-N6)-dimethylallyltransferase MiaA [Beijerinckiaceae bacterium]
MSFATLIAGPTASGKSALAVALAERQGGVVVNADSMQVYADLAVLSARPMAEETARVPHALYGFVPAGEEFSVGRYLEAIAPLVAEARAGGAPLVIVGGTGLYFRAMVEGLVPTPVIPPDIRAGWRALAEAGHDLHAELLRRDPVRAGQLHPADSPRLLRAIEVHAATGKPYSQWLAENPGMPLLAAGEWRGLFLDPPRGPLHAAIDARFLAMIAGGALDEVQRLVGQRPALPRNLGIMKAHGVPHLADHLAGRIDLDTAIARGQADTRAYARRQVIFARRYLAPPGWQWFANPDAALAAA